MANPLKLECAIYAGWLIAPVGIIPERPGIFRTYRHTSAREPRITPVSFLKLLFAGALVCSREVEIAYPVVGGRAEPDPPLRVQEKFPHHGLGMREGIFHDLAGARIQMANQILLGGCVPNRIVLIDRDGIGGRRRA